VFVGEGVDRAVQDDSISDAVGVLILALPFYEITDKVAHCDLGVSKGKKSVCQEVHMQSYFNGKVVERISIA
jgi:hypothetical protein